MGLRRGMRERGARGLLLRNGGGAEIAPRGRVRAERVRRVGERRRGRKVRAVLRNRERRRRSEPRREVAARVSLNRNRQRKKRRKRRQKVGKGQANQSLGLKATEVKRGKWARRTRRG